MKKIILLMCLLITVSSLSCDTDSDCDTLNSCESGKCKHKDIFPLAATEAVGTVLLFLLSFVSSAGGIGSGIVSTSFSLLFFKFDPHMAVALTQAFVFAVSFTSVSLKVKARHPKVDRPLIYYDLMMQLTSPLLLGVTIGVLFNPSLPSWLILASLTLVLIYVTVDIFNQGSKLYKKESQMKRIKDENIVGKNKENEENPMKATEHKDKIDEHEDKIDDFEDKIDEHEDEIDEIEPKINENKDVFDHENRKNFEEIEENISEIEKNKSGELAKIDAEHAGPVINIEIFGAEEKSQLTNQDCIISEEEKDLKQQLALIMASEKLLIPRQHLSFFIILIVFSIMISLIMGKSSVPSIAGIKICSPSYFGILVVYIIVMLLLALFTSIYLIRKHRICEKANYKFDEGDLRWTQKTCITVFLVGLLVGFLVGLIGLGGGFVIGPILLKLHIRPEVSTVSSSLTICISSLTALVQYLIFQTVDWKYGLWYIMTAVIGALGGMLGLRKIVISRGRVSLLIIILSFVSFSALVIILTVGIMNAVRENEKGNFQIGFKEIC